MTIGNLLRIYLDRSGLAPELVGNQRSLLADALGPITNTKIYPASITSINHSLLFLGNRLGKKYLGIISSNSGLVDHFEEPEHEAMLEGVKLRIRMGPAISRNAAWLRKILPFLEPRTIGVKKSAGCGDRPHTRSSGRETARR